MAKVTVLLPHFGCEAYLHQSAASILAQSETDLELCIIDDCSDSDRWLDALGTLRKDPRVRLFRSSQRVGPYRIKNRMIEACSAPYIAFQDADDYSFRARLSRQLAAMERGGAGLVGCSALIVDESGSYAGVRLMPPLANPFLRWGKSYAGLHPTSLVRREVFAEVGAFDGTTTIGADSDFLFRVAHRYRVRNLVLPWYGYRQRAGSLTSGPETGHGSALRTAYWAQVKLREQQRRRMRAAGEAPTLNAPPNDRAFALDAVD
ncbi:glycosyltransferase [Rugamonas sp. A1-17]|nr:glycosyltransferase [Rugamonas sp. A1-17]